MTTTALIFNALRSVLTADNISDLEFARCRVGLTCLNRSWRPEIAYGGEYPSNVCQRCFVLGRLCFNFSAAGASGCVGGPCDQCYLDGRGGCSDLDYYLLDTTPTEHKVALARARSGPSLAASPIIFSHILECRRVGTPLTAVWTLHQLRVGDDFVPRATPDRLPVVIDVDASMLLYLYVYLYFVADLYSY